MSRLGPSRFARKARAHAFLIVALAFAAACHKSRIKTQATSAGAPQAATLAGSLEGVVKGFSAPDAALANGTSPTAPVIVPGAVVRVSELVTGADGQMTLRDLALTTAGIDGTFSVMLRDIRDREVLLVSGYDKSAVVTLGQDLIVVKAPSTFDTSKINPKVSPVIRLHASVEPKGAVAVPLAIRSIQAGKSPTDDVATWTDKLEATATSLKQAADTYLQTRDAAQGNDLADLIKNFVASEPAKELKEALAGLDANSVLEVLKDIMAKLSPDSIDPSLKSLIIAKDDGGGGKPDPAAAITLADRAITVTTVAGDAVTLSWAKAADAKGKTTGFTYFVYQSTQDDVSTVADAEAHGTLLNAGGSPDLGQFTVNGLALATPYYFNVVVKNGTGASAVYARKAVTIPDTVAPTVGDATVTIQDVTGTSFTVQWAKAADNATPAASLRYFVYASLANDISTAADAALNGTLLNVGGSADAATFAATGLNGLTTYHVNVVVKDASGNALAYTPATVTTLDGTPPSLSSATITTATPGETDVTLNWTMATDNLTAQASLRYFVYKSAACNIGTAATAVANGTLLNAGGTVNIATYHVTGLQAGTAFCFNVLVEDGQGNRTPYTQVPFTTPDNTAPTVGNKTITATNVAETTVTLTWAKASDNVTAAGNITYFVVKSGSNNVTTASTALANGTILNSGGTPDLGSFGVTGLTVNTTYYFNVVARDEAGNALGYTSLSVTTVDKTKPTASSATIATSSLTETGVTLSWTAAQDNVTAQASLKYFVYKSTAGAIAAPADGTLLNAGGTAAITTYNVTGLSAGTSYHFNVFVNDAAGNALAYSDVAVTTPDTTAPTVADKTITTSSLTGTGVTLGWAKGNDNVTAAAALTYFVYQSSSNNIGTAANAAANGTLLNAGGTADANALAVTGLTSGNTYYFNVVVKDAAGNATAYTAKSVTTPDATPPTVSDATVTAAHPGPSNVSLSWAKATDNATPQASLKYFVYYGTSDNLDTIANTKAHGTLANSGGTTDVGFFTVGGLSAATTYYFNVIVADADGNEAIYGGVSEDTAVAKAWQAEVDMPSAIGSVYTYISLVDADTGGIFYPNGNAYMFDYAAGAMANTATTVATGSFMSTPPFGRVYANGDKLSLYGGTHVYARSYASGAWQTPVQIDSNNVSNASNMMFAGNARGDYAAAWWTGYGIQGRVSIGGSLKTDTGIGVMSQFGDRAMRMNAVGDVVVGWPWNGDAYVAYYKASTDTWTTGVVVNGASGGTLLDVAINDNGDAAVAYLENVSSTYTLYVKRRVNGVWQSPMSLESNTGNPSASAKLGYDNAGNILVTYAWKPGTNLVLYGRKHQGGSWSAAVRLSTSNRDLAWFSGPITTEYMDMDPATGVGIVVWSEFISVSNKPLFVSRYDGTQWSTPVQLNGTTTACMNYDVRLAPDGSAMVYWYPNGTSTTPKYSVFR